MNEALGSHPRSQSVIKDGSNIEIETATHGQGVEQASTNPKLDVEYFNRADGYQFI